MDTFRTHPRPVDGKAIAGFVLALLAFASTGWWILSAVFAVAAISVTLASRRSLRADPALRGVALGVAGFVVAVGCLIITLGPPLLTAFLFLIAPPS